MIIDTQLHEPPLNLDWEDVDPAVRHRMMLELELGYMDAVGVDRAVLFPIELDWGFWVHEQRPDRFRVVPMITPPDFRDGVNVNRPDLADFFARAAESPAVPALRVMHTVPGRLFGNADDPIWVFDIETYDPVYEACIRYGLPLFISTAGDLAGTAELVRRYPELTLIVDHLGMRQNPTFGLDDPPLKELPRLLALAENPRVHVKISGVPTLSAERYPFEDLWAGLDQVVEAFGADRLLWGTDISRVMGRSGRVTLAPEGYEYAKHNYAEALFYLQHTPHLTAAQKEAILGGTAARLLNWPA